MSGGSEDISIESASNLQLVGQGGARTIDIGDLIDFERSELPPPQIRPTSEVWLSNGDCLRVAPLLADEDTLTARWTSFPDADLLKIPLERIAVIWGELPTSIAARQKLYRAVALESQKADVGWLISGDRVAAEFTGLTATQFLFASPTGKLAIDREQLVALRFNPELIAADKPATPRYGLTLSDGSRVAVQEFDWNARGLRFTGVFGLNAELPSQALFGCHVFSDRLQPLSERQPIEVKYTPYLSGERVWVKNRNEWHGPLALRGREYAVGIGAHSQMELTYALDPQDREFWAVVGIDDCANGAGDVVFSVFVDGRRAWESPHVTGSSAPLTVPPIDLNGGKRLTLRVDFGEFGDVGDYADWCDAVIVRQH